MKAVTKGYAIASAGWLQSFSSVHISSISSIIS
jgi:hypothetical protein